MTDTTGPIRHYDAERAPKGVLRHVRPIFGYPKVAWDNRFMVANFFRRDLLGRFRGSVLGTFWVLMHPIFMFIVYFMVFGMLFGNWKIGQIPDPNFALYLFSGMIGFQALIEGTNRSCIAVVQNGNLVKKVAFPSEVLPLPVVLVSLTVYLVGAAVFLIATFVLKMFIDIPLVQPGWMLLTLPLVLLVQFVMTMGIGLFLANIYVFARDVSHLWGIISMAWLFLSPVFWFPNMMIDKLESAPELADLFFGLNPAYSLIQSHRIALGAMDAPVRGSQIVEFGNFWGHLGLSSLWAVVFFVIGYAVFMSRKHKFADLI